jgi:O-antigen ligase
MQKNFYASQAAILVFLILLSWLVSRLQLHYYLMCFLAILLPFSFEFPITENLNINIPSEPLLAIAVFSIGWESIRRPGLLKEFFRKENIWVILFLLSFFITSAFSDLLWVSVKYTIVTTSYILVFYFWIQHLIREKTDFFPKLILLYSISVLIVLAFSIYAFKQFDWNPITIRGIFRPFYKDNTILGATVAMLTGFWLVTAIRVKTLTVKILCLLFSLLFLAGTVLSNSRAAALSLLVFGVTWSLLVLRIRINQIAVAVVSMIIVLGIFRGSVLNFLMENKHLSHSSESGYFEQLQSSGNISSDISNIERMNRWISAWGMFTDRPLTGFGPGTYQFVYIPYQKKEYMSRLTVKDPWHIPENSGGTAHSEYFLVLSEMGILGILTWLLLIGQWSWVAFEKSRSNPRRTQIVMAFAVLSTYLFHAFFNNFLTTDKFAFLFWGTAAWMMVNIDGKKDEKQRIL